MRPRPRGSAGTTRRSARGARGLSPATPPRVGVIALLLEEPQRRGAHAVLARRRADFGDDASWASAMSRALCQEYAGIYFSRGSSASRSPSATRYSASTVLKTH